MPLPTIEKTWQIYSNVPYGPGMYGSDYSGRAMLWKLKELLKGMALMPWEVVLSCDGTNPPSASDTWTLPTSTYMKWSGSEGTAHSWIVLKQPGIFANFQICISLWGTATQTFRWYVYVSPFAGFSGGSTTSDPTASDRVTVATGSFYGISSTDRNGFFNVWQSNDGQVTRVVVNNGVASATGFHEISKPKSPVNGWNSAWTTCFAGAYNDTVMAATQYLNGGVAFDGSYPSGGYYASDRGLYVLPCEMWVNNTGVQRLTGVADELNGDQALMSTWLTGTSFGHRGVKKAELYDIWWHTGGFQEETIPGDLTRQFVAFGDLVLPWDGSVPLYR